MHLETDCLVPGHRNLPTRYICKHYFYTSFFCFCFCFFPPQIRLPALKRSQCPAWNLCLIHTEFDPNFMPCAIFRIVSLQVSPMHRSGHTASFPMALITRCSQELPTPRVNPIKKTEIRSQRSTIQPSPHARANATGNH